MINKKVISKKVLLIAIFFASIFASSGSSSFIYDIFANVIETTYESDIVKCLGFNKLNIKNNADEIKENKYLKIVQYSLQLFLILSFIYKRFITYFYHLFYINGEHCLISLKVRMDNWFYIKIYF